MNFCNDISVVVPAYNRVNELRELLDSVLNQTQSPGEVVICEDKSPDRLEISKLCNSYDELLKSKGISLVYVENDSNLGYDKNLRKCIETASKSWAMILGNDDVLLPIAISQTGRFIENNKVNFISRAFVRFTDDVEKPIGISTINHNDTVFNCRKSSSKIIFRSAGFVGGLVVNVGFARKVSTSIYDGSLYYQIYLASIAFCNEGIGYISTPIIGGRAENPPMFGGADDDKDFHVPGGYTAKGRARMWAGVIEITSDVGQKFDCDLVTDIRTELKVRQAFHVFEMNATESRANLDLLKSELEKLGLYQHPFPIFLYYLNVLLGKRSKFIYTLVRKLLQ